MEGNVEQIYKDGELVGERHVLDNRLGLAILRRLDRLAETGLSLHTNPSPVRAERKQSAPAFRPSPFDWATAIDAIRTGDDEAVATALALVNSNEVDEVHGPLNRPPSTSEVETFLDLSDRCWWDEDDECWMTDFPPPDGFSGYESRGYDDDDEERYERACTEDEVAALDADARATHAAERAEEETLRDLWFAYLRREAVDRKGTDASADELLVDGCVQPSPQGHRAAGDRGNVDALLAKQHRTDDAADEPDADRTDDVRLHRPSEVRTFAAIEQKSLHSVSARAAAHASP
jgi:hypothetical protein